MSKLSENKKIAICAIAIFIVSFSTMLFFLDEGGQKNDHTQTNVLELDQKQELSPEEKYQSYLKEQDSPFFVVDSEGKFKYTNELFCKLLALDCDKFGGKKLFDFINSKDLSDFVSTYTKTVQNGEDKDGVGPIRMLSGDKEKLLLFNFKVLKNRDEKTGEIVVSVKDLTEKAEELNDPNKQLKDFIDDMYPKIKELRDMYPKLLVNRLF